MPTDGKVVRFTGATTLDLDPDAVLEAAKGELSEVIILGFTHDGDDWMSGSHASGPNALWLIERLKHRLMMQADEDAD
jgi:hypothetical protein